MSNQYIVRSSSNVTAEVNDIVLWTSPKERTRLIFRPQLVDNLNARNASVKITLLYQKKKSTDSWEDVETKGLNTVRVGEEVGLPLSTEQTINLFTSLNDLYRMFSEESIPMGETKWVNVNSEGIIRTDSTTAEMVNQLLEENLTEEVWEILSQREPDLTTRLSYARI